MKKIRRLIKLLKIISPDVIFGVVGIIFLIFLFSFGRIFTPSKIVPKEVPALVPSIYDQLSLEGKAFYVYDGATDKILFSRNSDAQLPLASLTKVMMAVTALSILPDDSVVTIKPDFLKSEGDSGLLNDEKWLLQDLLNLTLMESSNDGASAVAAVAAASGKTIVSDNFGRGSFIDAMNNKASDLGLTQTYFLNPTGLDESVSLSGAYGSARDVATLFLHAISKYPLAFDSTRSTTQKFDSLSSLKHEVKNTNTFVARIPSLLASKTGYTDLAGGNLVIAFDAGVEHPIVIAVLGSTKEGRFIDAEKLVWTTLDYLKTIN